MKLKRLHCVADGAPFPVYDDLVTRLLAAHVPGARPGPESRDATVAHVLGTCAAYAYADPTTVATVSARLGLEDGTCVALQQTVDAMFIFSTAYLVQSRCGRVAVLAYRGTEAMNLGSWLGDADIAPEALGGAGASLLVHAGFYRNMRATLWNVRQELMHALEGRSLLDPARPVPHPLEALYVTGHSLGGAMALLFALALAAREEHRPIAERLRAVYTFGQPMAVLEPTGALARDVGRKVFRHVLPRDVVPALPPEAHGRFTHIGQEYRPAEGGWAPAVAPVAQIRHMRDIHASVLALVVGARQRAASRYSLGEHGPQHYLDQLRPTDYVTEFGERA